MLNMVFRTLWFHTLNMKSRYWSLIWKRRCSRPQVASTLMPCHKVVVSYKTFMVQTRPSFVLLLMLYNVFVYTYVFVQFLKPLLADFLLSYYKNCFPFYNTSSIIKQYNLSKSKYTFIYPS